MFIFIEYLLYIFYKQSNQIYETSLLQNRVFFLIYVTLEIQCIVKHLVFTYLFVFSFLDSLIHFQLRKSK